MIDLHIHTTASDGEYTPREVVNMAKRKGLELIAITILQKEYMKLMKKVKKSELK